jgi:acyl carrier protein
VDRKALPEVEVGKGEVYIAPGNRWEKQLVKIWAEVLGIEEDLIGIDSNFFDLGGHSIKATVMVSKVHKVLDVRLPLAEVFKRRTIRGLAGYIEKAKKEKYLGIESVEEKEYYEASSAQKRLWVLSQSRESSLSFNIPGAYLLKEQVELSVLNRVFDRLIKRHESLRTIFLSIKGDIKQKVLHPEDMKFNVEYLDLRGNDGKEEKVWDLLTGEGNTPFDLVKGPLLRAKLVQIEERSCWLLFTMHHVISDYLSMEVLRKEFVFFYRSLMQDEEARLKPLRVQYRDYTAWHNERLQGGNLERLREYWLGRFKDTIPILQLPYDKERPGMQSYHGEALAFSITTALKEKLDRMADENRVTLFMVLLTSVEGLLYHYTGQEDIVIGTPISGREHHDLENQIGFYLNMLPLRTQFQEENTFIELLGIVKDVTLGAYDHQLYPFDQLVDELEIKRDVSRHPLFDVVIDMINFNDRDIESSPEDSLEISESRSKFDLTIYFYEGAKSIRVIFDYNTDIFEHKSIVKMVNRYKKLLDGIIESPAISISSLQLEEEIQLPSFDSFSRH